MTLTKGLRYEFAFTGVATLEEVYEHSFFFRSDKPVERFVPDVNGGAPVSIGLGDCFHVPNSGRLIYDRDGVKVAKEWI